MEYSLTRAKKQIYEIIYYYLHIISALPQHTNNTDVHCATRTL